MKKIDMNGINWDGYCMLTAGDFDLYEKNIPRDICYELGSDHLSDEELNELGEEKILWRGADSYITNEQDKYYEYKEGKSSFYLFEAQYVHSEEYGVCKLVGLNDDGSVQVNLPAISKKKARKGERFHKRETTLTEYFPKLSLR